MKLVNLNRITNAVTQKGCINPEARSILVGAAVGIKNPKEINGGCFGKFADAFCSDQSLVKLWR